MLFPLHKEWDKEHVMGFEIVMEDILNDFNFFMLDGEVAANMEDVEYPIANMEDVVHWCYTNLQKKVRQWRNTLKLKMEEPERPNQERQKSPDPRVTDDEWKTLLEYWRSPTKLEECIRK